MMRIYSFFLVLLIFVSCSTDVPDARLFLTASGNGKLANEGFVRCGNYVRGWLNLADPVTGLIPRNTRDLYWNAKDAAADNYPFMVLTASMTDRSMFDGIMRNMLDTEIRLTSRLGRLPDTWDFARQDFLDSVPDINSIIFGSSEYVKDGLLPLTEWLGPSPWSERMIGILGNTPRWKPHTVRSYRTMWK